MQREEQPVSLLAVELPCRVYCRGCGLELTECAVSDDERVWVCVACETESVAIRVVRRGRPR
jgi:hypothetical protein